jgi:hypothetical protein
LLSVAAALRKKLQWDGTDLILERRLLAGRAVSHLLCESDHERQGQMVVESEYYSGRFGLRVPEDRATTLVREWINTKIALRYDPNQPSVYRLPDELPVDGFRRGTVPETDLASQH